MQKAILYIHGKGGNAGEADHYKEVCEGYAVLGLDYRGDTPWDTEAELWAACDTLAGNYESVAIVANSIGAYFAMNALQGSAIRQAFFISPIVDMEKLISDMMGWAGVTEEELRETGGDRDLLWGNSLLGISALCAGTPPFLEHTDPHPVRREGSFDLPGYGARLCRENQGHLDGHGERRALVPHGGADDLSRSLDQKPSLTPRAGLRGNAPALRCLKKPPDPSKPSKKRSLL